jgi:hypothetical protein
MAQVARRFTSSVLGMRIATLAITGLLAVGVAFPAAAAKKRPAVSEAAFASFEADRPPWFSALASTGTINIFDRQADL